MKGSSVQFSSVTQLSPTLWDHIDCSTSAFPVHHHLLELAHTHGHRVSDAIQPSHPLSSPSPPAFNLSQHLVFSNELLLCIRLPKYLSFSFSISPSNEYSGLFSFRIEQFDCLEVQGTLKSLLQHHSSKASILWHSAFFMVQLSHPYMTTGKKTQLRLDGPLSAKLSHSFSSQEQASFNFIAIVTICSDFGAQENKFCHCFHCVPIGTRCHNLCFLNVEF